MHKNENAEVDPAIRMSTSGIVIIVFISTLLLLGTIILNKVYTKDNLVADIFTTPSSTMIMRLLF